ncbi:MAG: cation:proton antiporter [Oligoflexia bacterium]|nr:cation:proton antiporter [Oligoflexia bacterium]
MIAPTLQLVFIITVGTLCQIVGWRTKIPSILLLLVAGIVAGPVFGLIHPDALFGSLLNPLIELAVAVILFEGGLSLSQAELGRVGGTVIRLISLSTLITWLLLASLSYFLLHLGGPASLLLGAILVISGPTVVIPLLRLIRARAPVEPILRWEGILIDPIGVVLAVLVAEVCESGIGVFAPWHFASGIALSLGIGISHGWIGSQIIKRTVGKHLVPDQFVVPLTLAVVFSLVTLSNAIHEQSGLLTSTLMGLFVASNNKAWVQTIEDFIGHTQRMFIGVLFIILAARLEPTYLNYLSFDLCVFLLIAILAVRPLSVFISTFGTKLSFREKIAISSLAPRGIVSAALASSLGGALVEAGIPGMQNILPYTFATIIGTVAFYALLTPLIFDLLGVRQQAAEGVLFMGGGRFAFALGKVLDKEGFKVAFVDSNESSIQRLRAAGMNCFHGNILSDSVQEEINFDGIGKLLACTSNDEANSLATVEFKHTFGSAQVYQLASTDADTSRIGGRTFCCKDLTFENVEELWSKGYRPFCRDVSNNAPSIESRPEDMPEFLIAEIENQSLFFHADDKLQRPTKPNKQVVFGLQKKGGT